jgi:NAD(P)-dependent dehydrogenase (short-subunit alcohol dehydrogenase family)
MSSNAATKEDFGYRTTAAQAVAGIDLTGKHAIVTGGYSGIGLETVKALAGAGASVTLACRDHERAVETASAINADIGREQVDALALSLDSQAAVKQAAATYLSSHDTLDILINNAAVMACPYGKTQDGFELQFGTNHLGHFTFFKGLLPALLNAGDARVVCLSSTGHFLSPVVFDDIGFEHRDYEPWSAYGQAKTANALMAVGIQQRYAAQGIEAFAVHPGGIMTSLQRHMTKEDIQSRGWVDEQGNVNELFKTTQEGASTSTWAATSQYLRDKGGQYLEDCSEAVVHDTLPASRNGVMSYAVSNDNANTLWELSEALVG